MGIVCKHAPKTITERILAKIATVDPKYAVRPKQGVIYWHIAESSFSKGLLDKGKIIAAFEKGFDILETHFYPLKFEPTKDKDKAPIELFFLKNGDKGLPEKFDPGVLAYAFFPGSNVYGIQSNIYFNDELRWSDMHKPGKYSLLKVFVHECLHALGLDHSKIKRDIMYPTYQPDDTILLTADTIQGINKLYGKFKIAQPIEMIPGSLPTEVTPDNLPPPTTELFGWIKLFFTKRYQLLNISYDQLVLICQALGVSVTGNPTQQELIHTIWKELDI